MDLQSGTLILPQLLFLWYGVGCLLAEEVVATATQLGVVIVDSFVSGWLGFGSRLAVGGLLGLCGCDEVEVGAV